MISPYNDGLESVGTKHLRNRNATKEMTTTTETIACPNHNKRLIQNKTITLHLDGKNFDGTGKRHNEFSPSSANFTAQSLATGAAHKSLRTLNSLRSQIASKIPTEKLLSSRPAMPPSLAPKESPAKQIVHGSTVNLSFIKRNTNPHTPLVIPESPGVTPMNQMRRESVESISRKSILKN